MASLFKDPSKLSAYRDRRFPGNQEEYEYTLQTSVTLYIGNMSFYTTEEQVYELFTRAGEIKKIIMGLDKNTKTPCGFCFVLFYSRDDAEDAVKYISGTILDDRPIRVDFDWGFEDGRQWGRGRSGGQVRDEYRTDYDPGRGGYGKLVQKELEAQRQLVDYGAGSLGAFQTNMPSNCKFLTRMVDVVVTVGLEVLIGMIEVKLEIIIGKGIGMTIDLPQKCPEDPRITIPGGTLITMPDQRGTLASEREVTPMMKKTMIEKDVDRLCRGILSLYLLVV